MAQQGNCQKRNRMVRSNDPLEGSARSVTVAEHQQPTKTRLRPPRLRVIVLAGGSAVEIPQAAAAVRTRLHGSGAAPGFKPIQSVCFSARGHRTRASQLFRKAERTGLEIGRAHV